MGKQNEPAASGSNKRAIMNAIAALKMPRVDVKDTMAIEKRMSDYLQYCIDNDVAPSVVGCASWLGINESTLKSWYTGYRGTTEHQRVANQFYMVLQDWWAQKMANGEINPVSGIFMGKVFFGYKDTQEIVVQQKVQAEISTADLIAESKLLPGAEILALPSDAQPIAESETELLDDPYYAKAAEREARAAERKAAVEAYAPIKKAKKKEYLKEYYKENKAEYNKYRKTPEGRAEANRKQRERWHRKKEEQRAQKEAEKAAERAQKEIPGNSDQP